MAGVIAAFSKAGTWSLLASRRFEAGEVIKSLTGIHRAAPTRTSIRVGPGLHAEDSEGKHVNHSCRPTAHVLRRTLVATRAIAPGEEITFDYLANEGALAAPFECGDCGVWLDGTEPCGAPPRCTAPS